MKLHKVALPKNKAKYVVVFGGKHDGIYCGHCGYIVCTRKAVR